MNSASWLWATGALDHTFLFLELFELMVRSWILSSWHEAIMELMPELSVMEWELFNVVYIHCSHVVCVRVRAFTLFESDKVFHFLVC